MPQMSPLSWTLLFFYFVILLILFCMMNFYIFLYKKPNFEKKSFKTLSLNWKW
uniref:ATP synthase complex subunit 8 n=2 Tax=Micromus TaxID=186121 RepID=A0A1S5QY93_9NEOP|nr:ATP synthase F0 subunit 8 [Micromus angulatus]AMW67868.1 ATP synthase F0 subunit 8 [Micromus sp. YW-2016]ARO47896.1 ATP synthase F0 subunit 8 [Micromus angulatus]QCE31821.1 ATP synthase F0 subunit 8 [Micromus angulatus]